MSTHSRSRREFLLWGGLVVSTPAVLTACESVRPSPTGSPAVPSTSSATPAGPATATDTGPDLRPPGKEPLIRVRIQRQDASATTRIGTVPVGTAQGGRWLRVSRPDGPVLLVLAAPVEVSAEAAGWRVVDEGGVLHRVDGGAPIEFGALRGESPAVAIDGSHYPGSARLVRREDGGIDTINIVPLESYLPGVLARELYADWRLDTYLAQAVAARSFAVTEIAFWRTRRHFDVVAGQASQAYIGQTGHAASLRAVNETRGVFLLWDGKVVPGYYSSSCGGHSASAVDAISPHPVNDIPPLAARPAQECCRWSPMWRWNVNRPTNEAARRIVAWAATRGDVSVPALEDVHRIEATAVNENGRPVRYRVTDRRNANAELLAEHLRFALNHSGGSLSPPKDPIRSSHFSSTNTGSTIRMEGRGFGHGAGLCQFGAEGFARRGVRWTEILGAYYRGARLYGAYSA